MLASKILAFYNVFEKIHQVIYFFRFLIMSINDIVFDCIISDNFEKIHQVMYFLDL